MVMVIYPNYTFPGQTYCKGLTNTQCTSFHQKMATPTLFSSWESMVTIQKYGKVTPVGKAGAEEVRDLVENIISEGCIPTD